MYHSPRCVAWNESYAAVENTWPLQFCGDEAGSLPGGLQDALSPSDMLLMAAQQKYSLRSQSLPAVPGKTLGLVSLSSPLDSDQLRGLAQELNNPFLNAAALNQAGMSCCSM